MKKIIIAAAVILTTGVLTVVTKNDNTKTGKTITISTSSEKNVVATAD